MDTRHLNRITVLERRVSALTAMVCPTEPAAAPAQPAIVPRISTIISACADAWHVPVQAIYSARRARPVSVPRQVAMHLARRLTLHSYPVIGNAFGRDHSTVMHADQVIAARCARDPDLAQRVETLAATLTARQEAP